MATHDRLEYVQLMAESLAATTNLQRELDAGALRVSQPDSPAQPPSPVCCQPGVLRAPASHRALCGHQTGQVSVFDDDSTEYGLEQLQVPSTCRLLAGVM